MPARQLSEYERKRDFGATPEPGSEGATDLAGPLTFVVHRHDATRLHHDLRLELDGVLMSWAVPRGPSDHPGDRRLAVRTEDHPIAYGSFEGVIPEKHYGAGTSIIWDAGTYAPDEPYPLFHDREAAQAAMRDGLERGKLSVTFRGTKLKGSWALVRTKTGWLLLKHRDAAADRADLVAMTRSAYSGRTNEELGRGVSWEAPSIPAHFSPAVLDRATVAPLRDLKPMLASAGRHIPASNWAYEPKLDGIRALAYLDAGALRLVSRGGNDITRSYPAIAAALTAQPARSLLLDGEVITLDEAGRPSFELLQRRMNLKDGADIAIAESAIPAQFLAFDVLHVDGRDVTAAPYWQRQELLKRLILPGPQVQPVTSIDLPPEEAFETAVALGFEGIVAKRLDSRYEPGRRTDTWRKQKALSSGVFTVVGWTDGEGSRGPAFGALVLAERQPDGVLAYRGRVGTGFNDTILRDLAGRLRAAETGVNPFTAPTPEGRQTHWVSAGIDVEVAYTERTLGGVLRAPVFLGLAGVSAEGAGSEAADLVSRLDTSGAGGELRGDGWALGVTNLDKPMWPAHGTASPVTKRDLMRYAIASWPWAAPHLRDRLVTLTRYPNGIDGKRFYQRHWDGPRPAFVETVTVYSDTEGGDRDFILCNNLPTLLWLCQLADLEWHLSLATVAPRSPDEGSPSFAGSAATLEASPLNYPGILLFDFDPYVYRGDETGRMEPQPNEAGFAAAKEAALALRELLSELGLPAFVKTSGATGLHVFVPIKRTLDFDAVRAVAVTLAGELVRRQPRLLTTEWATEKRRGKVFVDANQNARHKALAAPFSPRAHPGAPVSMPTTWEALPAIRLGEHTVRNAPAFVARTGDPWRTIADSAVDLAELLGLT